MFFKMFMNLYDNWDGIVCVNDNELKCIVRDTGEKIIEKRKYLWDVRVVAFGFYDNELCVRLAI